MVRASEFIAVANAIGGMFGERTVKRVFQRNGFSKRILTEPSLLLPNAEYMRFIEATAREIKQPLLGAMLGNSIPFSGLGTYGRYVASSATLPKALQRASRALKYHETGSRLVCKTEGPSIRLNYYPPSPRALGSWHQSDGVAAMLINLIRVYEGPEWKPIRLGIADASGERHARLQEFFGIPIESQREGTQLIGKVGLNPLRGSALQPVISQPLSRAELREMLLKRPRDSFSHTFRVLMETFLLDGVFELEPVSERICIGSRTLQRRLKAEGSSFSEILREVRKVEAEKLLTQTPAPVGEIAIRLGFSSRGHFIRAFRSWYGITPGSYRENQKNQGT